MMYVLGLVMVALVGFAAPAFADHHEVTIVTGDVPLNIAGCERDDECYVPSVATVGVGGKVIMINTDEDGLHTFTSITGGSPDGVFDSGVLVAAGESTFEWVPDEPGEYEYFCTLHPWMVGTIIVEGDDPGIEDPGDADPGDADLGNQDPGSGGGCLIATAAYGTELAPQVQKLRELRDNVVMNTESGSAFMSGFNEFYYSFSPYVADLERENPTFRELVRASITPMIYSLSILDHAEIGTEAEMVGYGVALIALNIAIYAGIPVLGIAYIRRHKK